MAGNFRERGRPLAAPVATRIGVPGGSGRDRTSAQKMRGSRRPLVHFAESPQAHGHRFDMSPNVIRLSPRLDPTDAPGLAPTRLITLEKGGLSADNLRHVLHNVEGHFLVGYGDASKTVHGAEPIAVLPGATEEARTMLNAQPATAERIDSVLRLVEGFESAYALELLATVHWVAENEDPRAAEDSDVAARLVSEWSRRKKRMFRPDHVVAAWQRLRDEGWMSTAALV
jgi:hypothetical protein